MSKRMTILWILINIIICGSGMLKLCICEYIWMDLRYYMNISVRGSGTATFDAALLALAKVGQVTSLASVLGCFCIAPAVLYLYGFFLAVLAILDFGLLSTGALVAYRNNLNERFDQGLNESMAAYGQNDSKSSHIDTMQSILHCCGNRGYADWLNLDPPKDIPLSCCKVPQDKCEPQDLEQIYTEGCYNLMLDLKNGYIGLVAGTVIGTTLFLLIGTFLSCCLASNINKVKQGVRCKETDLHTFGPILQFTRGRGVCAGSALADNVQVDWLLHGS